MKTHLLNSVKALTATALISGGIALSVPASATASQADIVTTKIDIRDLETDRGIAQIYKSLARRAESACRTSGQKSIHARNVENLCTDDLLIDFVQDVGDDRLTAYYERMNS